MPHATTSRLGPPCSDEIACVRSLLAGLGAEGGPDWEAAVATARPWVEGVRRSPPPFWAMESLLREYPISRPEGLALMRLAEALLRVPDAETAIALTADQLGRADFGGGERGERADRAERVEGGSPHRMLASLSASAIGLAKRMLPEAADPPGLLERLGAQTVVAATVRAIQLLGRQFVLGRTIGEALGEARSARAEQPSLRFSYDMLGEGARTDADARRYLAAYEQAIDAIARSARGAPGARGNGPTERDGISIKLSALHPRYEELHADRVIDELLPRVAGLIERAARADLNLTIDAEESDRLELSLTVFDALAAHVQRMAPQWSGFGLAIQAYQLRALQTIDAVAGIARARNLRFMVRLVKGAYWDGEIKRAQEMGLTGYPVFTHKHHTDISYLACAQALIAHHACLYPQFAGHNAGTIAAIVGMAERAGARYEMQRLHGMGEGVFREVLAACPQLPLRVYAPVGEHRDLLAYLVRRLLENGANSSFVHQLADPAVAAEELLASPLHAAPAPGQPMPGALLSRSGSAGLLIPPRGAAAGLCRCLGALQDAGRANSEGLDLTVPEQRAPLLAALARHRPSAVAEAATAEVAQAMQRLHAAQGAWNARPVAERAEVLQRAADALQARLPEFCALLAHEGGKTAGDAVAEVREAIDFCRYYAEQAAMRLAPIALPGPTGESNELRLHGRGVFVCISPWNFPLAIFAGQVVAALVAGNTVAAKPAEQTPAVAAAFCALLHDAGLPADALALLHGPGETIGAALVADPRCAGVCFTGSTAVAKAIQRSLAAGDGPIVPLIAETGGLNAMIVDSTALPEQVVDAVVHSAFRSAGQRCSALRLLCVHESIADALIEMLKGAMGELVCGAATDLATDVGPVIDAQAHAHLSRHAQRLQREATLLAAGRVPGQFLGTHIAPMAFEIGAAEQLREEVFGPVLHVLRWKGEVAALVARINALGYGLTLGIQTRIDSRALAIADQARIGNVYVNRNMIGAVVGVQPFGGEGLSGTGPKAGGPHYLYRFCAEQTLTINTAAAGGNAALLAG